MKFCQALLLVVSVSSSVCFSSAFTTGPAAATTDIHQQSYGRSTTTGTSTSSSLYETTPASASSASNKDGLLDTDALYAQSTFPIKPDALIELAKTAFIEKGVGTKDDGKCLADDFVFRAQFVEVNKQDYLNALGSFQLEDSFDIQQQFFGWTVDPIQTNRVWTINRQVAKFVNAFVGVKPDNRELTLPPQCFHIDFNDDGQIIEFGFYTVDRAQGNTGGLGGAFGYFYGVGRPLPFPEGRPYKMSWQRRVLEFVSRLGTKLSKKKKNKD